LKIAISSSSSSFVRSTIAFLAPIFPELLFNCLFYSSFEGICDFTIFAEMYSSTLLLKHYANGKARITQFGEVTSPEVGLLLERLFLGCSVDI